MTELGNPFLGHTVTTAKVAAVGDGNPQIIDSAVMEIYPVIHGRRAGAAGQDSGRKKLGEISAENWPKMRWLSYPSPFQVREV